MRERTTADASEASFFSESPSALSTLVVSRASTITTPRGSMRPQRLTRATVRDGIALTLTLAALAGCDAAPEKPRTGAGSAAATKPVETSSPLPSKDPGGPKVERSPEEMVLLRALERARLTQVGVPEHGAPGDA
jgi:hypothetical protein